MMVPIDRPTQVIEMCGASFASDIWSVGCTVIELLTGSPPYFDLAPMAALFRIVQGDHMTLPKGISPGIEDLLRQCFQKDPKRRPTTSELLRHPWLRQSKRNLKKSWTNSVGRMKNLRKNYDDVALVVERMIGGGGGGEPVTPRSDLTTPRSDAGNLARSMLGGGGMLSDRSHRGEQPNEGLEFRQFRLDSCVGLSVVRFVCVCVCVFSRRNGVTGVPDGRSPF
jgi:serine/threonine protein kinase